MKKDGSFTKTLLFAALLVTVSAGASGWRYGRECGRHRFPDFACPLLKNFSRKSFVCAELHPNWKVLTNLPTEKYHQNSVSPGS
jgi:hypothetical protein